MAHAHQGTITPRVVTVTVSDTRTEADDKGGATLRELLSSAGFALGAHSIVRDDREAIRAAVRGAIAAGSVDAVVLTGGTGIAPRDVTCEAVAPILDKTLDGFGEAFRRLSWDEVGPRAILSRALAARVTDFERALTHAAAADYLQKRELAFRRLERGGAVCLDVEPDQLPISLVNRYIDIKRSGRL